MSRPLSIIADEVRALSTTEKEALLRVIWEELDGPPDPSVEAAWLDEARRRSAELDSGAVSPVAAEDVFMRIRAQLRK